MFDLTDGDFIGVTLDCGGGASSFVAEVSARGGRALTVDPLYARGRSELAQRLPIDLAKGRDLISANSERFVWDWYGSASRHQEIRRTAGADFIADLRRNPERYLAGRLPRLPFADASVDLVLCSHLLFTWAGRFDRDWHRTAILEMCRVSRGEVRIFPLLRMGNGEPVDFLDELRVDLETTGGAVSECARVPYEFQRGADRMLRVGKNAP